MTAIEMLEEFLQSCNEDLEDAEFEIRESHHRTYNPDTEELDPTEALG